MPTVGYAAVDLLAILSATLFFGRAGAVAGMCGVLGAHLTGWAIVSFGVGPPPAIDLIDPRLPVVWIRHIVVLSVLGAVIAITELYVIEQLAREVQVHRRSPTSKCSSGRRSSRPNANTRTSARSASARSTRSTRSSWSWRRCVPAARA